MDHWVNRSTKSWLSWMERKGSLAGMAAPQPTTAEKEALTSLPSQATSMTAHASSTPTCTVSTQLCSSRLSATRKPFFKTS